MKVFLIAGEASGDRLGAALMEGLSSLADVRFSGVGGPLMQAQGLRSLFPMEELSVMGLVEILPRYPRLRRRLQETVQAVLAQRPDVVITIDSPEFSLRVARQIKANSHIRTVHYVAPSVWAWRAGRAKRLKGVVDQVLSLLPFEPALIEAAGVACDFVGHPVVADPVARPEDCRMFRERHGIGDAPLLMVLPGSRQAEVARMGPVFGAALQDICTKRPDLRLVVPTVRARADQVRQLVRTWPGQPVILAPDRIKEGQYPFEKKCAFGAANYALATSGSVSLELAASGTPMVMAYDTHWLTRVILQRMIQVDTVTLVNLVSGTRAVPEFLGKDCRAELIAPAVLRLLQNPDGQSEAMRQTMERLGQGGEAPGLRAAKAVLSRL